MNRLIKESVEEFYKNPVMIEGESEKTWNKPGMSFSLVKDPMKFFVLLLTHSKDVDYLIHFENYSTEWYTDEEKDLLLKAVSNVVDKDEIVTTAGGVTPGGISAIHKLTKYGFKEIGRQHSASRITWASDKLLDINKWNEWIKHANPEDYYIINKSKPLTIDNVLPVVPILKKMTKKVNTFDNEE